MSKRSRRFLFVRLDTLAKGGKGSGNFHHKGRKGRRGGSEADQRLRLIEQSLHAHAIPWRDLEFSESAWQEEFPDGLVTTPIGVIKLGENQHDKIKNLGRKKFFGLIKPTLENPTYVISSLEDDDQLEQRRQRGETPSRASKLEFIRAFIRPDGKRQGFLSITVERDGLEVSISSGPREVRKLAGKVINGAILSGTAITSEAASLGSKDGLAKAASYAQFTHSLLKSNPDALALDVLAKAEQLGLFDVPVPVKPYVRDGKVIAGHVAKRKKRIAPKGKQMDLFGAAEPKGEAVKLGRLGHFIEKHGGYGRVQAMLQGYPESQRTTLLDSMAKLAGKTRGEIVDILANGAKHEEPKAPEGGLFAGVEAEAPIRQEDLRDSVKRAGPETDPRQRAIEAVKAGKIAIKQFKNARGGWSTAFGVIDGNTVYSKPSAYSLGHDSLDDGQWRPITADEYDLWLKEYVDRGRDDSKWHGSALEVMAIAGKADQLVSEGKKREAESQSAEHQSLIAKYRLPADTTFRQDGKFLNAGKWRAVGGGDGSGYQDTPEAAAQELRNWIDGTEAGKKEQSRLAAATKVLVGKLKTGENPSFEEWKAVFPDLKPHHTYLRQPEISALLIEHFGFSRNRIRTGLGRAAGYLESDTGATYPIVYFNRLAEVLGGNKDNQGRDLAAVKRDDEPHEGDTKTEGGIEYRLQDGRWHRTTPEEKPAFTPTHELPDGTQVVAHADEANIWVDAQGDEYESEEAYPIEAERAVESEAPGPESKPANEYGPGSSNPFEVRPAHDSTTPFGVPPGTTKGARRKLNAACIDILQKGDITDADRETLRQYSGNGGCGDSLNEFYTSPEIAASMWQVVNQLGVTGGTVLEPSSGPGVFLHTATPGVRVTAVELDSTSANIARVLHGDRHEIHNASLERFATTDDRQFDAVIGNAPFGPRGALLGDDKRDFGKAEEYFLDTALDKTKPAGIVAMIVPTGIMDSKNGRAFRERLLRKAEFLGAQRMPNSAFEHSHTDVTTDVVYFRKRPDAAAGALSVVDRSTLQALGVWDDEFLSGTYFEGRGAGNLFGRVSTAKRAFGEIYTVEGSMQGIPEALREFTAHPVSTAPDVMEILAALTSEKAKAAAMKAAETRPYANTAKVGDTKVVDGITYVLQGQPPRWHRVDEANMSEAVIEASDIAQRIDALMSGEGVDRGQLETDIKAWVGRHGVPAKNANLMIATATDKTLYRLIGAVGKDGELSDAVRGVRRQIEGSMAAVAHSLALSRRSGVFTAEELAATMGKEADEIQDHLVADPEFAWTGADQWTTRQAYLTGELWPKLDAARAALDAEVAPDFMRDKLKSQIQALEESIGSKPLDDVDIAVNSAFIPLEIVSAYFTWKDQEGPNANKWTRQQKPVEITFADGVYSITGGSHWGMKLVDKYLNRSGVKKDEIDDINAMNEDFKAWLCQSEYREQVEELYNRKFLGFVEKDYSQEPIEVPGLANQDQLRDYQWPGLRWALERGKGIIAADVGLGKTARGLLLARMAKLNGSAQKPIIVVPKSVLANWYAESQKWFPGSRVLTIGGEFAEKGGLMTGKDDNAAERKRKYHDLSQNDYDFVLISEPAFEELDLDPVKKKQMHDRDFWVQRGDKLGNAGDKTVRKIRENYEQAIAKRDIADRTDAMYFNDLGVDMIIADEMHHQKNLYAARSRFGESPKFLGGQGQSQRALDFNLKARWLLENNGNKGVYGLTATPSKNSPLEIYSMLSHVAPEAFENIGIRNSEEFLDRFALFERGDILDTKGVIAEALITAGFKNLGELRSIMNRYIDKTTAADVGLKLPDRDDRMHFLDMTDEQQAVYEELRQQLEESAGKKDATGDAHIFSIMDKMNKAALDLEILDPGAYAGANSPKYDKLAANLMEFLPDGGQVVFSDFIDSHEKIAQALVRQGIPRNQIGILNAQVASSSAKRQQIADAFNAGKLRVVIGNTAVMGEGINLQKSTTDIHHLDLPWEPASMQQRNGRGLRQGNINEAVRIHTYLAKGSFDGYRYQSIAAKKDWQDILWHGADKVENLAMGGKVSRDELMIMMSADPEAERAKREADQEGALSRLAAQRAEEASGEFIRFQSLKASYKALKSKENRTAALLQDRINKSRNALRGNKYFKAKSALDMDEPVLLHPVTGDIIAPGMRIDLGDGAWVVTAVDVPKQTATARRYGQSAALSTTFKVHQESFRDAVVILHDERAENAEIRERMEREAAEKPISSMDELFKLPRSYVEANQEQLQRTAWDGAGNYRFSTRLSGTKDHAVMLNLTTGKPELVPYWDIGKKATAETHRFVMPTEADQAAVGQAWMNAERTMKHGTKLQSTGRRNSRRDKWIATRKYAEASATDESGINPWTAVLSAISGDKEGYYGEASPSVKAIQKRFAVEQVRKAMKAKTFREALDHMAPLGEHENPYEGHSTKVVMPTKGIMILWAKAKREGILDQPIEPHVPQEPTRWNPEQTTPKHTSYFVPTERNMGGFSGKPITVREALVQMASNKRDAKLMAILAAHDQRKTP